MIIFGAFIMFFYTLTMFVFYFAYRSVRDVNLSRNEKKTQFSILIPFRNEEDNLNTLLDSLKLQSYPTHLFELVLVNDGSTDKSKQIIHSALNESGIQYVILNNERYSDSPKKDAITKAIKNAKHKWIMTTDADCMFNSEILSLYDDYIQNKKPFMIVGPVGIEKSKGLNYYFQQYEHLALQTLTIGGFGLKTPFLCNGANLVYMRDLFTDLNGYKGNDHISSGDDIFLFEKFREKFSKKIHYIRSEEAIVSTSPLSSWKEMIEQRVRWASKISSQKNPISKWVGLCIFITNLWLISGLIYCFFIPTQFVTYFIILFYKAMVDFVIISSSCLFLSVRINLYTFAVSTLIYPFVSVWVSFRSLIGTYRWKGRKYNNPII
jgi:glycosyltransferase involved in cell wall biosynthesis